MTKALLPPFDTIKEYAGDDPWVSVHAVAYANKEDLSGDILNISRDGYALAQDISSYSLIAVTKYAKPILAGKCWNRYPFLLRWPNGQYQTTT